MKRFWIVCLTFMSLELSQSVEPDSDKRQLEYFINNPGLLDYKVSGKKEEHRFGVEVKENKQFHHTITAEDGVRLGCYGFELDGKSHSTHYVADDKGYRLVPHNSVITVYPKDGAEPRLASFVQAFTEDEIKGGNIRYLFPEGCQAPKAEIDQEAIKASLEEMRILKEKLLARNEAKKAEKDATFGVKTGTNVGLNRIPKRLEQRGSSDLSLGIPDADSKLATKGNIEGLNEGTDSVSNGGINGGLNGGSSKDLKAGIKEKVLGGSNNGLGVLGDHSKDVKDGTNLGTGSILGRLKIKGTLVVSSGGDLGLNRGTSSTSSAAKAGGSEASDARGLLTEAKEESTGGLKSGNEVISSNSCCDEIRPQIQVSQGTSGCSQGFSKIVIPVESEKLAKISMAELLEVTAETSNAEVLRKLLKLVEKYNL